MKKLANINYLFAPLVLVLALWGCNKTPENPVTDFPIIGTENTIQVEQNGIEVTFCLLNGQDVPDTVFSQGENFKFYLAIKNNVQQDTALYMVSEFLRNPGLFTVYHSNGEPVGEAVIWYSMNKISDQVNQVKRDGTWYVTMPWHETRGTEEPYDYTNLIKVLQHFFMGENQPMLSAGRYYTTFSQQFCLGRYFNYEDYSNTPFEYVCTDTLSFKVNFEIK
jgi:hypothetical protein